MRVARKVQRVPRSHGRLFGLVPYDSTVLRLPRARRKVWNPVGGRLLVPTLFGIGWTVNSRSVRRHPLRAEFLAGPVAWRASARKRR